MKNLKTMGIIATNKNQNILFYNSNNSIGKQCLAYTEDSKNDVLTIDVSKTKVADTQWVEICDKLNLKLEDLVNKEHPNFSNNFDKSTSLSSNDWLKVIQNNPEVIVTPILVVGETFYKIETPSNVRTYLSTTSEGIDEKIHI